MNFLTMFWEPLWVPKHHGKFTSHTMQKPQNQKSVLVMLMHELKLKVGTTVMLVRNLNQKE
jgi:hypothetical protein